MKADTHNQMTPASRAAFAWLFCAAMLLLQSARADKIASAHPDWTNIALGKSVQFKTAPSYPDTNDPVDAKQLVDGSFVSAKPIWYDKGSVGWLGGEPVEFTIDLGADSPIRGVALRVAGGQAGVGWPQKIVVSVSQDGEAFAPLGDVVKLSSNKPPANGYGVIWLKADALKTHGRFVKFNVTQTDSGQGIYFFTDEVEIYKGDDAFLKLPLPAAARAANPDSPCPELQNIAADKPVKLNTAPNDAGTTDPDDAKQLVDGKISASIPMWNDKTTLGWSTADPVVFTVDLGTVQPIRGLALHLGAGQAGAEWPASIQVYVSETGDKFSPVGDVMQLLAKKPPAQGYAAFWLLADKLETHGRYVKFSCAPRNLGTGSYIFLDELEIYRGDDALLKKALASVDSPAQWKAVWSEIQWNENVDGISEAERPKRIKLIDGKTETGSDVALQQATVGKDGVTFTLNGEASKSRSMSWTGKLAKPLATSKCRYAVLTFKAEGILRTYEPRALVSLMGVNDQSADNVATLLVANMAPNDGRSHTLVTQIPEGLTLQQIKVSLVTEDDHPKLTLERLELLSEVPAVFGADVNPGDAKLGFSSVDLGTALNGSVAGWYEQVFAKYKTVLDGARALKAGPVVVSGVPFVIAAGEKNLAMMPDTPPPNRRVEFLGKMTDECFLEPPSRNDELSVAVDANAREALLLLALSAPAVQVLGGQPHIPLHLDDIECLSIELTYDRGENETAVPYSLADKGCFIPARLIGAYAVAVDPTRKLKKITLHNRQFGPNYALAALTLNTSDKPVAPELVSIPAPEVVRQNTEPSAKPVSVAVQGKRLTIGNRWFESSFDLSQGFVLDRFANRWNEGAGIKLSPTSGLRLRVGDTVYTGRCFSAEITKTTKTSAELKLTSTRKDLPLDLTVTITADDSPELSFIVTSKNRGTTPLAAELCLPALDGLTIGNQESTRILFPQYRAVDTGENIALRAPYGPEFTSQFIDIYSRAAGTGVMVRTNNLQQQMVHFALRKDESGVSGGVCFSSEYTELAPGASLSFIPVSLIAHNGDWRSALAMYREWVRTWYKPFRSQDKDYFRNAWEIACYRTSIVLSWLEQKAAPFINEERTKFMTDEVFAFEKKTRGHNADLVHFYNWSYNDEKKANDYGVHSTPAVYQHVGGIEFFRKGIDDIQTRLKTPLSLYTVIDRFRASLVTDESLAKELVDGAWHQEPDKDADVSSAVRGSNTKDGTFFVRCGHERWTEFVLNDIIKMQQDTGCKMVYIDVFSFWSHLKGHNGTSPRQADLKVLKYLKEKLPADVALWAEYPPSDVGSQYHDGSLQYYFLTLNEVFARRYNYAGHSHDLLRELPISIGRYVLTRYKSFGLPGYIEACNGPSQVDAIFMNGEGIQEDTWRLHHSRIRERLNRAYDIKRKYTDCFNTDSPSPFVDTVAQGIIANCFPGNGRTLWTLYNARPKTYSGVVLSVPHKPGAIYRDVWNDKELTPTIENGIAKIAVTIDPQIPGCVIQEVK